MYVNKTLQCAAPQPAERCCTARAVSQLGPRRSKGRRLSTATATAAAAAAAAATATTAAATATAAAGSNCSSGNQQRLSRISISASTATAKSARRCSRCPGVTNCQCGRRYTATARCGVGIGSWRCGCCGTAIAARIACNGTRDAAPLCRGRGLLLRQHRMCQRARREAAVLGELNLFLRADEQEHAGPGAAAAAAAAPARGDRDRRLEG